MLAHRLRATGRLEFAKRGPGVSHRRTTRVLLLCGLSLALIAASRPLGNRPRLELLIGSYSCSYGAEDVWTALSFDATGDVLREAVRIYRQDARSLPPSEYCSVKAAAMHVAALSSGCRTSGLVDRADGAGGEASFRFLCLGDRDGVVEDMANISEQLYQPSP
jgi:hypothetical protein